MAAAGAEQPGSSRARYEALAASFGRSADDQEDLWLLVITEWRLTIDQWEALPWWQQDAYLRAWNRKQNQRAAEQKKAPSSATKKARATRQAAKRGRPAPAPKPAGGGGRKLKDSPLWASRKDTPPPGVGRVSTRGPRGPRTPPATP